jgi:hypothetical protein
MQSDTLLLLKKAIEKKLQTAKDKESVWKTLRLHYESELLRVEKRIGEIK